MEELRIISLELCDELNKKQVSTMETLVIIEFIHQAAITKNTHQILKSMGVIKSG